MPWPSIRGQRAAGPRIIDPVAVRRWLKLTVGRLQRETNVAVWLVAHQAASGNMVSGSLDWQNFGRLVLHLEHKPAEGLILTPGKDNTGFPFARLRLDRDPETLITTVIEADRIADRRRRGANDPMKALSQAMLFQVLSLPEERRTRRAIEPVLFEMVRGDGIKRATVRDFLDSRGSTSLASVGAPQHRLPWVCMMRPRPPNDDSTRRRDASPRVASLNVRRGTRDASPSAL